MPTLTEAEKLSIARKLGVTYVDVNDKVTYLGDNYITAQVETDIRTLLTEWDSANLDSDYTRSTAAPGGWEGEDDPESQRGRIRRDLALMLYFTNLNFSSAGWGRNTRG